MLAKVPLVPGLSAVVLSRLMAVSGMTSACFAVRMSRLLQAEVLDEGAGERQVDAQVRRPPP